MLAVGAGFMLMMMVSMHSHMLQLKAQSMAERYRGLQAATQRYVQVFRAQLGAAPGICSNSVYEADAPPNLTSVLAGGDCAAMLRVNDRATAVENVRQPTLKELRALGLLAEGLSMTLLLDRDPRLLPPDSGTGRASAPAELAVMISSACTGIPCPDSSTYEYLVYNVQPYMLQGGGWTFSRRDQVVELFNELGNGALMSSDTPGRGDLTGPKGEFTRGNPVRDGSGAGHAGIVGLRAASVPNADSDWARRDGHNVISGAWDFNAQDISGVASLKAKTFDGTDLRLTGRAELDVATARQMDVDSLTARNVRLPVAAPGQTCLPTQGDLAVQADSGKLLLCDRLTLAWSHAVP